MRWALVLCALLCAPCGAQPLSHGRFKDVTVYQASGDVQQVVLFFSGDEGWNSKLAGMARVLAGEGALVAGIDSPAFFADLENDEASCVFPDGDLENLSRFLQAYYRLPTYRPPMLVGYSTAAAFVYAMLAQAPADTFAGGISLGFCPQLRLQKPLCADGSLRLTRDGRLMPARKLDVPWIGLHEQGDGMCSVADAQRFVSGLKNGELHLLPVAPDEDARTRRWTEQLTVAFRQLASRQQPVRGMPPQPLKDLPIVEVPVRGRAHRGNDMLAVILSGDGGWANIDKQLAAALVSHGIAVVGLDALRYFWTPRTPQSTASDVDRILRHYLVSWNKRRAILIGYSQGADVLPFVVRRLPPQSRARLQLAAMLGPSRSAIFEFHLADWFSAQDNGGLPLLPEVREISAPRLLCVYGAEEIDSPCPHVSADNTRVIRLPGGHHFDGDYAHLAALILAQIR